MTEGSFLSAPAVTALILAALVGALILTKLRPVMIFGGLFTVLLLGNIVPATQLFHNFTHPALVVLVLLVLMSVILEKTTLIRALGHWCTRGSVSKVVFRSSLAAGLLSAVINNTAVVSALMKSLTNTPHSPGKLLLPLSYATILGGTLTLVGTSTNLMVNGFVINAGMPPIGFFDFTLLGVPVFILGVLVITLISAKLLPDQSVDQRRGLQHYLVEARLAPLSPLVGKSIGDCGLRQLEQLFLVEIVRPDTVISPVTPKEQLQAGDLLVFSGDLAATTLFDQFPGLALESHGADGIPTGNLVEVVVTPHAMVVGKSIKSLNFRAQFDAAVVAIRRGSHRLEGGLGRVRLQGGDMLILATGPDYHSRANINRNFIQVGETSLIAPLGSGKSVVFCLLALLCLLLGAFDVLPLYKGLVLMVGIALVGRFITINELRRRFPFELVIVIGTALGLAQAIEQSGLAAMFASALITGSLGAGPYTGLILLYLLTWAMTELVTNTAAAAITFPVGLALAAQYGVDAKPFIMTVAFAASASFLSPHGYQTNLMVYTAGGYRNRDYLKAGLPLSLVYGSCVILLVPGLFPW